MTILYLMHTLHILIHVHHTIYDFRFIQSFKEYHRWTSEAKMKRAYVSFNTTGQSKVCEKYCDLAVM